MLRPNRIRACALLMLMMFATAAFAGWEGESATVDGRTVVSNPETPAFGETRQEMREMWRRGGDDDEECKERGPLHGARTLDDVAFYILGLRPNFA